MMANLSTLITKGLEGPRVVMASAGSLRDDGKCIRGSWGVADDVPSPLKTWCWSLAALFPGAPLPSDAWRHSCSSLDTAGHPGGWHRTEP